MEHHTTRSGLVPAVPELTHRRRRTARTAVPSRRTARRVAGAGLAALLLLGTATMSQAATKVTVTNPGGLTSVGPVNAAYGFPSWYGDSAGAGSSPASKENPLCGFLPGDVPNPDAPIHSRTTGRASSSISWSTLC